MESYTGVGSRIYASDTAVMGRVRYITYCLASMDIKGHSGSAAGIDTAFEWGAMDFGKSDCFRSYLPEPSFQKRNKEPYVSTNYCLDASTLPNWSEAVYIARNIHPNWKALSRYGKLLHARNAYEVLRDDLKSPTDLFLYCAEHVNKTTVAGGTNTAFQLARIHNIETYNLSLTNDVVKLNERLGDPFDPRYL